MAGSMGVNVTPARFVSVARTWGAMVVEVLSNRLRSASSAPVTRPAPVVPASDLSSVEGFAPALVRLVLRAHTEGRPLELDYAMTVVDAMTHDELVWLVRTQAELTAALIRQAPVTAVQQRLVLMYEQGLS